MKSFRLELSLHRRKTNIRNRRLNPLIDSHGEIQEYAADVQFSPQEITRESCDFSF